MLIIISPAKTLDFSVLNKNNSYTIPCFLDYSQNLISILRKKNVDEIIKLMNISPDLAQLNFERFQFWDKNFTLQNAKQALLAFKGEVYRGIDIETFSSIEIENSQNYLRILSGLYGILRPLDLIQPYRLEMGIKLENERGKDLYKFWGNLITEKLNETLIKMNKKILINLASEEYSKVLKFKEIKVKIITPIFKEEKNGKYQTIAVFAKKARGLMTRFIIQNQLTNPQDLKAFNVAGYYFDSNNSNDSEYIFIR
jgi:cytoplasmic iron level regulating protein YaaA (DUF328/UPF0246 family)